jgi:hypothetical protein
MSQLPTDCNLEDLAAIPFSQFRCHALPPIKTVIRGLWRCQAVPVRSLPPRRTSQRGVTARCDRSLVHTISLLRLATIASSVWFGGC